jgi:hypothetical protein
VQVRRTYLLSSLDSKKIQTPYGRLERNQLELKLILSAQHLSRMYFLLRPIPPKFSDTVSVCKDRLFFKQLNKTDGLTDSAALALCVLNECMCAEFESEDVLLVSIPKNNCVFGF